MIHVLNIRMLVQLLQQPNDVLSLIGIINLDALLSITPLRRPYNGFVRELDLAIQILLLQSFIDRMEHVRLAFHDHGIIVIVLHNVVCTHINRDLKQMVLVLILRELAVSRRVQTSYRDRSNVIKET